MFSGNGGSQSRKFSESVMPGYSGANRESAAAPASGTIRSTRNCAVSVSSRPSDFQT